jgi:hypothetical protein
MIGLGLGPYMVAFFTDTVFKDESLIRFSLVALPSSVWIALYLRH